jgi:hypothetical protein
MPVSIAQLRTSATVDLMTAADALGLGRTKAYDLARNDTFPCQVIRIGETYHIPNPGLLRLLGAAADLSQPAPAGGRPPERLEVPGAAAGPTPTGLAGLQARQP